MAAQPTLVRLFPNLASNDTAALAMQQWASCGALGMPVLSLGSAAIAAALPHPPEFCGWAQANMGATRVEASLSPDVAQRFVATLRSSASLCVRLHPPSHTRADPACSMPADPSFAEQMTHFPPETLAVVLGVSPAQARLLLGCACLLHAHGMRITLTVACALSDTCSTLRSRTQRARSRR